VDRQGDLFPDRPKLVEEFERFDAEHPDVWAHFERVALDLIRRGRKHYSSDAICHVVRWHIETSSQGVCDFKVNDHFTAFYSRKFGQAHPEHAGFFERRRSVADEVAT